MTFIAETEPGVAGVDEAGRGPLAGPVVAAAVLLDPAHPVPGLADSKRLSPPRREALARSIRERALAWATAHADVAEIDRDNVLAATLAAMARAVAALDPGPERVEVDGNRLPPLAMPATAIVGGDGLRTAIAAASILAKVERDAYMLEQAAIFPEYGFDQHKGYGTSAHRAALARFGPCPLHRRSFAPVRAVLGDGGPMDTATLAFAAGHAAKGSTDQE
jgi:ribonuclease HII